MGPGLADGLVQRYGAETLTVIEERPEELAVSEGLTARKAQEIGRSYRYQTGLRRLLEFFRQNGLPLATALRLYHQYGADALDTVRRNPYLLVDERYGVSFSVMDEIALSMGLDRDSRSRVEAAVLFELSHNLHNGHVFLPRDKLLGAVLQLIDCQPEQAEAALGELLAREAVCCEPVARVDACYLRRLHEAEVSVTEKLGRMLSCQADRPA